MGVVDNASDENNENTRRKLAGVLAPPVAVDNGSTDTGVRISSIFQCLHT